MKLTYIVLLGMSIGFGISFGMNLYDEKVIQLPNESELRSLFDKKGLTHFDEKTEVIKELAGTKKSAMKIRMIFEEALHEYQLTHKMPPVTIQMTRINVEEIIKILCAYDIC